MKPDKIKDNAPDDVEDLDDGNFMKGLVNGVCLSLPLWAIIIGVTRWIWVALH